MQPNAARIVSYFREVKSELRKVHWPSRQETVYYTLTVIAVSVAAAVFLG
ncbi:MAG: preprotein translocase subunit SecE, partial [bacterium]|nr:preprotein translocase subunit SecE [bacterium]